MNRRGLLLGIGAMGTTGLLGHPRRAALAQGKVAIRLGDIIAADVVYVAAALAAEKGFFAEEGLDVKRGVYANGPAVTRTWPPASSMSAWPPRSCYSRQRPRASI